MPYSRIRWPLCIISAIHSQRKATVTNPKMKSAPKLQVPRIFVSHALKPLFSSIDALSGWSIQRFGLLVKIQTNPNAMVTAMANDAPTPTVAPIIKDVSKSHYCWCPKRDWNVDYTINQPVYHGYDATHIVGFGVGADSWSWCEEILKNGKDFEVIRGLPKSAIAMLARS